jgi:hypothetical protein
MAGFQKSLEIGKTHVWMPFKLISYGILKPTDFVGSAFG